MWAPMGFGRYRPWWRALSLIGGGGGSDGITWDNNVPWDNGVEWL